MLLALLVLLAGANEGMWLPEQLPALAAELGALGFDAPALVRPGSPVLGAIVSLGGCSASFVSAEGLVLTNHHCVSELLQANSDAEHNLARDGYLARSREEELWGGPSARAWVVLSAEDVSVELRRGAPVGDDRALAEHFARRRKALVDACERGGMVCEIAEYHNGAEHRLIRALELQDLRLVYAPPESVGSYGGEVDNWMWPRHAGDFALLRVYVGPDQAPAEHSPANVPYRPPHHLPLARGALAEGDGVLSLGFPGHTARHAPYEALRFEVQERLPVEHTLAAELLAGWRAEAARDPEAAARLGAPIDGWANYLKYLEGLRDNTADFQVLERKQRAWAELLGWVGAGPERAAYSVAFRDAEALGRAQQARGLARDLVDTLLDSSDLARSAYTAWRLALERRRPDREREEGWRRRDEGAILDGLEAVDQSLWLPAERVTLRALLTRLEALPAAQRIGPLADWIAAQGGVDAAVERLVDDPLWASTERRRFYAQAELRRLEALDDPMLGLVRVLEPWLAAQRAQDRVDEGARLRLAPPLLEALRAQAPGPLYPDANGTLRLSFGRVRGYVPADGVLYTPFTTLQGLVDKAGAPPFDAPPALLAVALRPGQAAQRVNFLTDLDTTGGNSGSAVLNPRGELVGLVFDGNYESMSADWLYDPALTRTICVDVGYVLWVLEQVEGAAHLVGELLPR